MTGQVTAEAWWDGLTSAVQSEILGSVKHNRAVSEATWWDLRRAGIVSQSQGRIPACLVFYLRAPYLDLIRRELGLRAAAA